VARLEHGPGGIRIVAESPEELRLLADAFTRGRELALSEGLYPISLQALGVPEGVELAAAERLRRAFEAAARGHQRALERRRRFRRL
jgi:hypothetical protein